ncbi:serine/threonine-protein kinase [Sphingomonas radiodurans]|uniref:serine/threonine-protein kinase n=1 Tax=Sphingomonas radiodurans TaxID=2890321 RepID=UPI001E39571F|nr:serine/threonine-protein kinase [Sphingomonas radiodurans]WBH14998.1 serine/threonine-protein kinase [Sphingomonas radiodurans]
MSRETERRAMGLIEEALELPSDERSAYIEGREDVSAEVRTLALAMMESDREGHLSIRTGGARDALGPDDNIPPELPGYRILRQLGRGGMGAVWLAERTGSDFAHQVAIKVIKPGVLQESIVERFRRERQILAQLNHPNIGHLHDGGETADGQPIIVMEYIRGITLREWLQTAKPTLDQRLKLFRQVAGAVGFAHQNLVIHRDLTPSNVLVTDDGQAKLIDFGIARPPLQDDQAARTSTFSALSLTPGFAAPEREQGLASNTLTDIFSLGRLFALLIEGQREYELEAIAERASAPAKEERYQSVSDLIDDLDAFHDHRPVTAVPDSRRYRFAKFVERERTIVIASTVVMVALVVGLLVAIWAYDRAETARGEAEQRFDQLRDLARFQLFELYDAMDNVVGNTAARVALAQRAQGYLITLAASRSDDPELQLETAQGFLRLSRIQGVAAHPNFGESALAAKNIDRAEPIFRALAARGISAGDTGLAMAESYRALWLAHSESKPEKAKEAIARAEAALARVPAAERNWEWMQARRIARVAALERADLELDTPVIARYVALVESDIGDWPANRRTGYEARFDRAMAENYRAIADQNRAGSGDPLNKQLLQQSLGRFQKSDRMFGALEADFRNDPLVIYRRAWNAYYGYAAAATLDEAAETERLLTQARSSVERLMKIEEADHSLTVFAERLREAQAQFLSNAGRHAEAIPLMAQVIEGRRGKIRANRRSAPLNDLAYGQAIMGTIYRKAGMRSETCAAWAEAEALMVEVDRRGELHGFIKKLRPGVQANLRHCRAGDPISAMTPLDAA